MHLLPCIQSLLVALTSLLHVLCDILFLELAHALNFVEIDDKARVVRVMQTDAFAAEDSKMVGAVEMLHTLGVLLAQLLSEGVLVLLTGTACLLEIEICLRQDRVLFHDLIEDVDVEGESLSAFKLLHEFAAYRASHSVIVMQVLNT